MYYAAESLDMGITHQIGVLLQSAVLYFCDSAAGWSQRGFRIRSDTAELLGKDFHCIALPFPFGLLLLIALLFSLKGLCQASSCRISKKISQSNPLLNFLICYF